MIVTPDGLILSFIGSFEGKMNDQSMFTHSGVEEKLLKLFNGKKPLYIYGDSGYQSLYTVITPFSRQVELSKIERQFNLELSHDQISVEQAFRQVTNLWKTNAFKILLRSQSIPVASLYEIAVLLSNCFTCLRGNEISERYNIRPPTLEQYLMAAEPGLYYFSFSFCKRDRINAN